MSLNYFDQALKYPQETYRNSVENYSFLFPYFIIKYFLFSLGDHRCFYACWNEASFCTCFCSDIDVLSCLDQPYSTHNFSAHKKLRTLLLETKYNIKNVTMQPLLDSALNRKQISVIQNSTLSLLTFQTVLLIEQYS